MRLVSRVRYRIEYEDADEGRKVLEGDTESMVFAIEGPECKCGGASCSGNMTFSAVLGDPRTIRRMGLQVVQEAISASAERISLAELLERARKFSEGGS